MHAAFVIVFSERMTARHSVGIKVPSSRPHISIITLSFATVSNSFNTIGMNLSMAMVKVTMILDVNQVPTIQLLKDLFHLRAAYTVFH